MILTNRESLPCLNKRLSEKHYQLFLWNFIRNPPFSYHLYAAFTNEGSLACTKDILRRNIKFFSEIWHFHFYIIYTAFTNKKIITKDIYYGLSWHDQVHRWRHSGLQCVIDILRGLFSERSLHLNCIRISNNKVLNELNVLLLQWSLSQLFDEDRRKRIPECFDCQNIVSWIPQMDNIWFWN